jgi:D-tyrosyl-tRNA(Tyr) deacylase
MKAVIQRVSQGGVKIGEIERKIGPGLVVLLGVKQGDTMDDVVWTADKCLHLRIFEDAEGKMNRSVLDTRGAILIVSQFTLYGDCRKGRRPGFTDAAPPEQAIPLYESFVGKIKESGLTVETGEFGASMQVSIENDGPVTLIVEKNVSGIADCGLRTAD